MGCPVARLAPMHCMAENLRYERKWRQFDVFAAREKKVQNIYILLLLLCPFLSRFARSLHSPVMAQCRLIPCGGLADGPPSRGATPESDATRWRSLRTPPHHKARRRKKNKKETGGRVQKSGPLERAASLRCACSSTSEPSDSRGRVWPIPLL